MDTDFNYLGTANIEAKLHKDLLEHEDKVVRTLIIVAFILMYIFRGAIGYWLKFGVAIPKSMDFTPIPVKSEPIQTDYSEEEKSQKTFVYTSLINSNQIIMIPQAHYVLSGRVIAYNRDFLFKSEFFDSAALYDLGASWGDMANKDLFEKYVRVYSDKVELTGARRLNWQFRSDIPVPISYATSHISHSHIIPANRNIMAGFLTIKRWDNVQVEGELVDMTYSSLKRKVKYNYHTSMTRTDDDSSSRGSGACESVYVTKLRVGNRVYE